MEVYAEGLWKAHTLFGMEVYWDNCDCMKIRKRNINDKILKMVGMMLAERISSRKNPGIYINAESDQLNDTDTRWYHSIVGQLLYLATKTSPDICIALSIFSLCVESLTAISMRGAKRVVLYLRRSIEFQLRLSLSKSSHIQAYVDANCGEEPQTGRRSKSGIMILNCRVPIFKTTYV